MTRKTHVIAGIATGIILRQILKTSNIEIDTATTAIILAGSYIGSIIPDIDCSIPFIKHRTLTHSLVFFFFPILISQTVFFLALSAGIASHIILDGLNSSGVSFFYPLPNRYSFKLMKIKINSIGEILLRLSLIALIIGSALSILFP